MIEGKKLHSLTLMIETYNDCEGEHSIRDLLRKFQVNREFQINQTLARIIDIEVNDVQEKRV